MPLDSRCSGISPVGLINQGAPGAEYAYVRVTDSILQFSIGIDGTLQPLSSPKVMAGITTPSGYGQGMVADPIRHNLYSLNLSDNDISIFSINSDGTLTGSQRQLTVTNPNRLVIDASNSHLWVSGASEVAEYSINPDGSLTSIITQSFPSSTPYLTVLSEDTQNQYLLGSVWLWAWLELMAVAPDGRLQTVSTARYANRADFDLTGQYVIADGYGQLSTYKIGSAGALMNTSTITFAGDVGWVFNQNKTKIFAFESGASAGIFEHTLSVGSDGVLTQIQPTLEIYPSALSNAGSLSKITFDPSGNFLYIIPYPFSVGYQFAVDGQGVLTPLNVPTFGGNFPGGNVIDMVTIRY
jgi:6-phosphogluconolactonase (cycloisomerase 2 family)